MNIYVIVIGIPMGTGDYVLGSIGDAAEVSPGEIAQLGGSYRIFYGLAFNKLCCAGVIY